MNFSNSRNVFNSFYRNIAKNKQSMKFFNTNLNSKKSLIYFSNRFHFSTLLTLSTIISGKSFGAIFSSKYVLGELKDKECMETKDSNSSSEFEFSNRSLIDIAVLNNCKIFFK
jgi:hypothetical protein